VWEEVLLNRLIHPRLIPDMGFRSLTLRENFDLIHVHAHPVRLARRNGTPLVMSEGSSSAVYIQDYLNWSDERLARAYARTRRAYRALGIDDRLLALDRVQRSYVFSHWALKINLRWGADPRKMTVVYPGFPTPPVPSRSGRSEFTFLFVGTDFERKGGFEVVEAFDRIAERHMHARLVLVTSDPWIPNPDRQVHGWVHEPRRTQILERLRARESDGTIRRVPLAPQAELFRTFYAQADAFVMPSWAEGFGFTNVEAMSFGLPVLSTVVGAIPEAITDGVTGTLVTPGDVDAMERVMDAWVRDERTTSALGDAARADFLARFTLERFRAELARVYREAREAA
jgi:glycosyltransferase involved in cell wall biosynthesis